MFTTITTVPYCLKYLMYHTITFSSWHYIHAISYRIMLDNEYALNADTSQINRRNCVNNIVKLKEDLKKGFCKSEEQNEKKVILSIRKFMLLIIVHVS